jgi:hypothetical protein
MPEFPFVQVDDTLRLFDGLQLEHQAVATKTKTLHDACDRLVCFSPIPILSYLMFNLPIELARVNLNVTS